MKSNNPKTRRRQRAARREREKERRKKAYDDRYLRIAARYLDDPQEYGSCLRKNRYYTKEDALGTAVCSIDRGVAFLRAYECPYCGGWHLTKMSTYGSEP